MGRDDRRTMMLQAAREVVFRYGYRKATLEDVAKEAGVSRATLYNYFPNKQELFRAIIVSELDGLRGAMADAVDPAAAPDEQLRAWLRARYTHLASLKELYAVVMGIARDVLPVAMAEFDAFRDEQLAFLRGLLQDGVDQGRFRPVDDEALAKALWSSLRGLDEGFVFEGRDELAQGAEVLVDTVLRGLRP